MPARRLCGLGGELGLLQFTKVEVLVHSALGKSSTICSLRTREKYVSPVTAPATIGHIQIKRSG